MPSDNDQSVHQPHDKGYKYLLSSKKIFIELLRSFTRESWVDLIDETNLLTVDSRIFCLISAGRKQIWSIG
jgi:hypothetical protein